MCPKFIVPIGVGNSKFICLPRTCCCTSLRFKSRGVCRDIQRDVRNI